MEAGRLGYVEAAPMDDPAAVAEAELGRCTGQLGMVDAAQAQRHGHAHADQGEEMTTSPLLESAAVKAVSLLREELERVDGDFERIDFEVVHGLWIERLSAEERQVVETYIGEEGAITPSMIAAFEELGCFNLPEPDLVN
jgi:hypothetical protein